jgi:hypothetical protein
LSRGLGDVYKRQKLYYVKRNIYDAMIEQSSNEILFNIEQIFNMEETIDNIKEKIAYIHEEIKSLSIIENLPRRLSLPRAAKIPNFDYGDNSTIDNDNEETYINLNDISKLFYQILGKIIEIYISINFLCPYCNKCSLSLYCKSNMPIIDLVCKNATHPNNKVKYFQVKSTNNMNTNMDTWYSYFTNYSNNEKIQLKVSTINPMSLVIHSIKPKSSYKELAIGYICIKYWYDSENKRIIIDKSYSFIVLPNITIDNSDEQYYIHNVHNNIIEVNRKLCTIINLKNNPINNTINLILQKNPSIKLENKKK